MPDKYMLSPKQLYQETDKIKAEIVLLRYKNEREKEILKCLRHGGFNR